MSRKRVFTADELKERRKEKVVIRWEKVKQTSRFMELENEIQQHKKKIDVIWQDIKSLRREQKKISFKEKNISVAELTGGECKTWREFSIKKGIKATKIWYAVKLARKNKEQITLERLLEIIGSIKDRGKK